MQHIIWAYINLKQYKIKQKFDHLTSTGVITYIKSSKLKKNYSSNIVRHKTKNKGPVWQSAVSF